MRENLWNFRYDHFYFEYTQYPEWYSMKICDERVRDYMQQVEVSVIYPRSESGGYIESQAKIRVQITESAIPRRIAARYNTMLDFITHFSLHWFQKADQKERIAICKDVINIRKHLWEDKKVRESRLKRCREEFENQSG